MLYYVLYHVLQKYFSPLNVFRYITVRTVYASLTAMFLALVFGPWLIRKLRELQIGQYIREEGPQEHQKKAGTPTMGGVLIVLSTAVPVLLWAIYQYLLLVYAGRTVGMQVAAIRLITFKGLGPSLRQRRIRVLGLCFSTASLIMGLLWALVDADALCWHDRISGTYLTKRE